jgi:hypothetical protein
MGVTADWAELPFLETIHIGECPAGRAPDDEVHDKEVMRVILIKIYRLFVIITRNGHGRIPFGYDMEYKTRER